MVNLSWRGHEALHRGRIYITHCAAKKDDSLEGTGRRVTPDLFYAATPTQRFMRRCRERGVRWAIFSDHYGVWFSGEPREWYGDDVGDRNRVTEQRFRELYSVKCDACNRPSWLCLLRAFCRLHYLPS